MIKNAFAKHLKNLEIVAKEIASKHADDVDQKARFPIEAVTALKEIGAFIWPIQSEYGGCDASPLDLAKACYIVGQHCSATAAVLSMHYTQILSVVHHANENVRLQEYLKLVAKENRLIASVTSEVGPGGNMRSSSCAVESKGNAFRLLKQATTISYGSYADDLMITARKDTDAPANDQVLVIAKQGQFKLENIGEWDTMGMRGTCSPSATITAIGEAWQILDTPFAEIASNTMVPTSHIFWSAWWLGLATDAVNKCRTLFRKKGKSNPAAMPLGAHRIADLEAGLQTMAAEVFELAREYTEAIKHRDTQKLTSIGYALRMNNLKLNSSRAVVNIVTEALASCGIQAYQNNGPYSLGRHLRDAHSSMVMVHNDRLQQTNASILLVHKGF